MDYKKRNYLICAIIFISFAILINGFILFGNMSDSDSYITPGLGRWEWLFSSNMMFIAIRICNNVFILGTTWFYEIVR